MRGEPLANEDSECARIVLDRLDGEGIVVRSGVTIARVEHVGRDGARRAAGRWARRRSTGSHLLVPAGRRPNVDGLGLDKARIKCPRRASQSIAALRTRNRRVYAVGDVIGGCAVHCRARYQAGVVVRNTLRRCAQIRAEADSGGPARDL